MLGIRRFRRGDAEEVMRLHQLAQEKLDREAESVPWHDNLDEIERDFIKAGGEFLVGVNNGQIVATGAFKPNGTAAEIKWLRSHPHFNGRGYEQLILEQLQAKALDLGLKTLFAEAPLLQKASIDFYQKNGFKPVGQAVLKGFNCALLEKPITRPKSDTAKSKN